MIGGVKWFRALMIVAFLGVFTLATNHCRLEVLKGLEFLVCCSHDTEQGETTPHQDDDCETDGCASLEEGLYKSEDGYVASVVPTLITLSEDSSAEALHRPLDLHFRSARPELPRSWQFLLRAAFPPRAPSLVS